MSRRIDQRRAADRKRAEDKPWRKWYGSKRWIARRADQLARVPWCEPCRAAGRSRPANTADHAVPHRGDERLFLTGKLTSMCPECHSAAKQREENEGFSRSLGADGWPVDPAHPFNRART